MSQPRCKTCRWWKLEDADEFKYSWGHDPATYDPLPPRFEVRYCASPVLRSSGLDNSDEVPAAVNEACVIDGSGYMAKLITAADFGCVNHEPAPSSGETTEP